MAEVESDFRFLPRLVRNAPSSDLIRHLYVLLSNSMEQSPARRTNIFWQYWQSTPHKHNTQTLYSHL